MLDCLKLGLYCDFAISPRYVFGYLLIQNKTKQDTQNNSLIRYMLW